MSRPHPTRLLCAVGCRKLARLACEDTFSRSEMPKQRRKTRRAIQETGLIEHCSIISRVSCIVRYLRASFITLNEMQGAFHMHIASHFILQILERTHIPSSLENIMTERMMTRAWCSTAKAISTVVVIVFAFESH